MIKRSELPYILLEEGQFASFKNFNIQLADYFVTVTAYTIFNHFNNIIEDKARAELETVKDEFESLMNSDDRLNKILANKPVKFVLAYDTGKAGIVICEDFNGEFTWLLSTT